MKKELKQFIVRKYVMAADAQSALNIEKTIPPTDVFIDTEWKKDTPITPILGKFGFTK